MNGFIHSFIPFVIFVQHGRFAKHLLLCNTEQVCNYTKVNNNDINNFWDDTFLMIIRLLTLSFRAICKTKMVEVLVQSVILASFNLRLPKPFRVHTKAAFSFYAEHYCLHNRFQWPSKHYIQGEDMMSSPDRNGAHRKCDWGMWQAADGSFAPDNDSNRNTITIQLTVPLDFGHKGWLKMQTQSHICVIIFDSSKIFAGMLWNNSAGLQRGNSTRLGLLYVTSCRLRMLLAVCWVTTLCVCAYPF